MNHYQKLFMSALVDFAKGQNSRDILENICDFAILGFNLEPNLKSELEDIKFRLDIAYNNYSQGMGIEYLENKKEEIKLDIVRTFRTNGYNFI